MRFDINTYVQKRLKADAELGRRYGNLHREIILPARTTLLEAGGTACNFYYVKRGCLRLWFNHDGKDITLQFFLDGQGVASIESFIRDTPSQFSIETITPCVVWEYKKADVLELIEQLPGLKEELYDLIIGRLIDYTHLFLSQIRDTPQQRYENLLKECPEIIEKVPQHYIASYLGITSVSLSRIKNRR